MANKNNLQDEAVKNAQNVYRSEVTMQAQQKANSFDNNPYAEFKPSEKTQNAYNYWQSVQAARPEDYQSKYAGTIDTLLDKIVNRQDFKYDFNADPLYQQYKDQYTTQGKNAMKDTVAQVSNMTGGYGNSYAATAGSQAYQNYLQQLNERIPELYAQALNKYQMDTDALNNKFNVVGSQEDREFGQWSTKYDNWQQDRDYGLNAYNSLWNQDFNANEFNSGNWKDSRDFAYSAYRDLVGDDDNAYGNAYNAALDARNYDYQQARDAVDDARWQSEMDYQRERDAVADKQWAAEYALSKYKAYNSGKSSSGKNNGESNEVNVDKQSEVYRYAQSLLGKTGGSESAVNFLIQRADDGAFGDDAETALSVVAAYAKELGISQKMLENAINEMNSRYN